VGDGRLFGRLVKILAIFWAIRKNLGDLGDFSHF
jgi:hypothetical protein